VDMIARVIGWGLDSAEIMCIGNLPTKSLCGHEILCAPKLRIGSGCIER
jgi:hypothetical protein